MAHFWCLTMCKHAQGFRLKPTEQLWFRLKSLPSKLCRSINTLKKLLFSSYNPKLWHENKIISKWLKRHIYLHGLVPKQGIVGNNYVGGHWQFCGRKELVSLVKIWTETHTGYECLSTALQQLCVCIMFMSRCLIHPQGSNSMQACFPQQALTPPWRCLLLLENLFFAPCYHANNANVKIIQNMKPNLGLTLLSSAGSIQ